MFVNSLTKNTIVAQSNIEFEIILSMIYVNFVWQGTKTFDFSPKLGYDKGNQNRPKWDSVRSLSECWRTGKDGLNKVLTIIGCITAAVAVVTAAFAVLNYFKEKKENAELEAYLEGSIQ